MPDRAGAPVAEYAPTLVEGAVLGVLRGHPAEPEFRAGRDACYAVAESETQERAFRRHHAAWFERLGLDRPLDRALREVPSVAAAAARCLVTRAQGADDEAAELFVAEDRTGTEARRTVLLRLRPESFTDPARLLGLLRHELAHVADLVDPGFGYRPERLGGGALPEALLRERYRVLWDASIAGRLDRRGHAPAGARARHRAAFTATFPMLGDEGEAVFARLWDGPRPTHAELLAAARAPERLLGAARRGGHPGEPCPLCGAPTHAFEPAPARLAAPVQARIRASHPDWAPADGLCQRCAEHYTVLARSEGGSAPLPMPPPGTEPRAKPPPGVEHPPWAVTHAGSRPVTPIGS